MFNLSLRTKLILIISIVLILAFVPTSLVNYFRNKEYIRSTTSVRTMNLISDSILSEMHSILLEPINISSMMANNSFVKNWVIAGEQSSEEMVQYLSGIREKYGYFSTFFVSDNTNKYYHFEGILKEISPEDEHDWWYYIFKDNIKSYDLDVDTDEASDGSLTVFINHRLEDYEGNFIGVIGIGLRMDSIGKILAEFRLKYDHEIFMIDDLGLIQAHQDSSIIEKVFLKDLEGIGEYSEMILNPEEGIAYLEFDRGEEHYTASKRYFPDFKWFLVIEQNESKALHAIKHTLLNSLLVGFIVLIFVLAVVIWVVNRNQTRMEILATTDELTGLYNRRYLSQFFLQEAARAKRAGSPTSMLQMDLDHFKDVNDEHGHFAGDRYLKEVAQAMKAGLREIDCLARTGGEEFAAILVQTDADKAFLVAERIRTAIEKLVFEHHGRRVKSTISIGLVTCSPEGLNLETSLKMADKALYQAKNEGRNRVVVYASK